MIEYEYESDRQDDDVEKGGLDPAPVTPPEEKADPEAGTGSADKRSEESLGEHDGSPSGPPGESGGDIAQ